MDPKQLSDQWKSCVIETKRSDGQFDESQVLRLLREHRPDAQRGLQKIERLQDIGWPEARTQLKVSGGRRAVVRPDTAEPEVWELKTNPHPWRFYFHVDEAKQDIIYAFGTYKKRTEAHAGDIASARHFLGQLFGGTARRAYIAFP